MNLSWQRLIGGWKRMLGLRQRRGGAGELPASRRNDDDSLEREIERAHAMRIGEPLEQPSRQ